MPTDSLHSLWTVEAGESVATTGYHPPDGARVGYVWGLNGSTGGMAQQVFAIAGASYTLRFYSGTHNPAVHPSIERCFYNRYNAESARSSLFSVDAAGEYCIMRDYIVSTIQGAGNEYLYGGRKAGR